ncbi:hypothetical protein IJ674_10235 [bacterium]|nr:hypothetical protein [bacterium]
MLNKTINKIKDIFNLNQNKSIIYGRYDYINNETETDITYLNKTAVILDATRFYHEHFKQDDDYDENFKIKSFKQAVEFWDCNGYEICNIVDHNRKTRENKLRNLVETLLYDDLNDYLRGVRDCLNIVQDVDYIEINESLDYIQKEVNKLVK